MKNGYRYDDTFDDGMGMDELIGRHLKNYAERTNPLAGAREKLLLRAQDQTVRSPMWLWGRAYIRTIGHLLWAIVTLRWLEGSSQAERVQWIDEYLMEDYALNQWYYRCTTMNSFLFGSGNFTLTG